MPFACAASASASRNSRLYWSCRRARVWLPDEMSSMMRSVISRAALRCSAVMPLRALMRSSLCRTVAVMASASLWASPLALPFSGSAWRGSSSPRPYAFFAFSRSRSWMRCWASHLAAWSASPLSSQPSSSAVSSLISPRVLKRIPP